MSLVSLIHSQSIKPNRLGILSQSHLALKENLAEMYIRDVIFLNLSCLNRKSKLDTHSYKKRPKIKSVRSKLLKKI